MPSDLKDDETRLSRFGGLSAAQKSEIRAKQKADLAEAEKNRKRPISSRAVDAYYELNPLVPGRRKEEERKAAAEDVGRREQRYMTAKQRAEMSDEDMDKERALYGGGVRKIDPNEKLFKKGGVVSASKRADGIAQRGKTRGKMR